MEIAPLVKLGPGPLTAVLLGGALLAAWSLDLRHNVLESYVAGAAGRIGYWGDWRTRFRVGEPLDPLLDSSMPAGFERVYLRHDGEIVGALPHAAAAVVRAALAEGRHARVSIVALDPYDPARGIRVEVAFERGAPAAAPPLATRDAVPLSSLL